MLTLPDEDRSAYEQQPIYSLILPPPALKARVLAAIGRVRQLAPVLADDNGIHRPEQARSGAPRRRIQGSPGAPRDSHDAPIRATTQNADRVSRHLSAAGTAPKA